MAEFINCPACAAQFPYMPDLIGLRVDCPNCHHAFTVNAPPRGMRVPITIPPAPVPAAAVRVEHLLDGPLEGEPGAEAEVDRGSVKLLAAAPAAPPAAAAEPSFNNPFLSIAEQLRQPLRGLEIDLTLPGDDMPQDAGGQDFSLPDPVVARDGVLAREDDVTPLGLEPPEGIRLIESPPPPPQVRDLSLTTTASSRPSTQPSRPQVNIKRPPRQWTTADRAVFNVALVVIVIAVFCLLMPLTGLQIQPMTRLGEAAPLAATLLGVIGIVTCTVAAFRQFAKWVFLGTSGVFGLAIIALFTYAAIKSPGSYDAPALAQNDVQKIARPQPAPTAATGNAGPARVAIVQLQPAAPTTGGEGGRVAYEALSNRYGPQRVVRISVPAPDKQIPDASLASKAHESLSALAPAWHVSRKDDHLECILAPVDDFASFVEQIETTVAKPSEVDPNQRKLTLRLPQ